MKIRMISLGLFALLLVNCEKIDKDLPECIRAKIKDFAKTAICKNETSVALYVFQSKNVYVFSEGTCGADLGATVYGENCEKIGYLGGFTGNLIISGVKFYESAEFQKEVWHD